MASPARPDHGAGSPYAKDDQDLWIAQATKTVKKCAFYMRKAIDEDNVDEALRHAAALLGELRTSLLGPRRYYELYVLACDELRPLEAFFADQPARGRPLADLYENVQHAGNVLPRLYLLCIAGATYIKSKQAPAKLLLQDMADMCKGVQHPTRGLFLRAYLVQSCRGLLPDEGSAYAGDGGGDIGDAVEFLLANFAEMNRLWVRMKHQQAAAAAAAPGGGGGARGAEARERERAQLADLVGKNLTQLSQLEGLTFELYRDLVLPRVLEQIVACKDDLAQGYLMQCVAAAFPDEFHVGALEALLGVLPQLQPGVKLAAVMGALLERLAACAARDPGIIGSLDRAGAFQKMREAAAKSVEEHRAMPAADLAQLHSGLLSFAAAVYPTRLDFLNETLEAAAAALGPRDVASDARAERQLAALLAAPLEAHGALIVAASLPAYAPLLRLLSPGKRREAARRVAEALVRSEEAVDSLEKAQALLSLLGPMLGADLDSGTFEDSDDVAEDAALLAKVIHFLKAPEPAQQLSILEAVLAAALAGGAVRAAAAVPPLFFSALSYAGQAAAAETTALSGSGPCVGCECWYKFLHKAGTAAADARAAELALSLFLAAAQSASQEARLEMVAYELFEQAFIIFEEAIPDSNGETRALASAVAALHACRVFGPDNRAALTHKASSYCAKLLHRSDQCMAALACAHLFWQEAAAAEEKEEEGGGGGVSEKEGEAAVAQEEGEERPAGVLWPPVRDGRAVLAALKRALRIANAAQQQLAVVERRGAAASAPGRLFVEILNAYVYWYGVGVPQISEEAVQGVLDLVASEMGSEACREDEELQGFYARTLAHVRRRREGDDGGRWAGLKV